MNGTNGEQTIKPHSGPFGRNSANWTDSAATATRNAKKTRPGRESGVVFGSEIMKKEKISKVSLSI